MLSGNIIDQYVNARHKLIIPKYIIIYYSLLFTSVIPVSPLSLRLPNTIESII